MNLEKLIKECYLTAVEKGHYNCSYGKSIDCPKCSGTGIYKYIPDLIAAIAGEVIGEAQEAYRLKRFAPTDSIREQILYKFDETTFETYFKDSFEDEISDSIIALCSLAGYCRANIEDIKMGYDVILAEESIDIITVPSWLFKFVVNDLEYIVNKNKVHAYKIGICIGKLVKFAKFNNIEIEKHIQLKMEYNKTRPYLHGKG